MADRQGIEIDHCPQCRGVWLDRGELDKLIRGASHDEERSAWDTQRPGRRRRSMLRDFFDFD
jgi:Zn-finger nucleic acid-binding protein